MVVFYVAIKVLICATDLELPRRKMQYFVFLSESAYVFSLKKDILNIEFDQLDCVS